MWSVVLFEASIAVCGEMEGVVETGSLTIVVKREGVVTQEDEVGHGYARLDTDDAASRGSKP